MSVGKWLFAVLGLLAIGHQQAHAGELEGCDDRLKAVTANDPDARVVLVKPFAQGERLALPGDSASAGQKAQIDLCLVKIMVGPGNAGPAGAPSTTQGAGIEIWLPAPSKWNERIHALGGGGFQGGVAGSPDRIGGMFALGTASSEGAVSSVTDAGHASEPKNFGIPDSNGDFLMLPDGSPNVAAWRDFAGRAIHLQAKWTKAVTRAFYGHQAKYSYWDGSSTGGRQGHKLAQDYPEDFDGIVANLPALHWTRLLPAMAYSHVVFQRDLGGRVPSIGQQDLVSQAAISACDMVGGQHLGYILDPTQCRYDPTRDKAVLCVEAGGNNATPDCIDRKQALAFSKMWYGPTIDGSVPDPAKDNGWSMPLRGKHLWYGLNRGVSLYNAFFTKMLGRPVGATSPEGPTFLGTDQLALNAGDAALAQPGFTNVSTPDRNGWKKLSYRQFGELLMRGRKPDRPFAGIDTDNPDLTRFKTRGGKLLFWHGTNDEVIPAQGSMAYYDNVVRKMGGLSKVQDFYRLFVVPGPGHQSPNGSANPAARPPGFGQTQMYELLTAWVEKGVAPDGVVLGTSPGATAPACAYPFKRTHIGGDVKQAASYRCK